LLHLIQQRAAPQKGAPRWTARSQGTAGPAEPCAEPAERRSEVLAAVDVPATITGLAGCRHTIAWPWRLAMSFRRACACLP
jgi:hypothetical protein